MKNKPVHLKTYIASEDKEDQDSHMIFATKSKNDKERTRNNVRVLRQEIKGFIKQLVEQILRFYCIELRANDIKRDLVENMVTNMILKDEIYVIMFRLYSELYEDDYQVMKALMEN